MRHGDCRQGMAASQGVSPKQGKMNGYSFRCSYYIRTGGTGCKGGQIPRDRVERETFEWLADTVAEGVDAAAPAIPPRQRRDVAKDRARAARERARLQGELVKLQDGLARLRADRAVNPDDYRPASTRLPATASRPGARRPSSCSPSPLPLRRRRTYPTMSR
ncbi:hypothetical protein ACIOHO_11845 [Streptomyces sp. NPDC087849]|uniref:hypothetical protein n=1 Tax=Streptomyces sp. NPDC087849 TaxID=3365808 RepID=UPI003821BD9C